MKQLYFPNLFRVDEYRKSELLTDIPYYQKKMDGEVYKAFQVGVTCRLLEQLLFYDRIYIDLVEVPMLLNVLNWLDSSSMKEIVKKGYISFVNYEDINMGVAYNKSPYFGILSVGKGDLEAVSSVEDLRKFVFTMFNYCADIDEVLTPMYANSIIPKQYDFTETVKAVDRDIKDAEIRNRLGINSMNGYQILKKDVSIINSLSVSTKNLHMSKAINVNNFYSEDVILDIMKARYQKHFSNDAYKFNQLLKSFNIPDIELLMFYHKMNVELLLKIRDDKKMKFIMNNIMDKTADDREIMAVFMAAINQRLSKSDIFFKSFSILTSTVMGFIDPVAGLSATAIGEVVSSLRGNQGHPSIAMEKIAKIIEKNCGKTDFLPNVVTTTGFNKHYIVE